jgi:glycyl-tRNA synthetase beta chain
VSGLAERGSVASTSGLAERGSVANTSGLAERGSVANTTRELLFELGTEEIPAGGLSKALAELPALVKDKLAAARLPHGEITVWGTPRRLAISVAGLVEQQPDLAETVTGPPASAAWDKEGKPTKAAIGFAAKNGVAVESLTTVDVAGPKGSAKYAAAKREQRGEPTLALLPKLLVELTRAIPWKKSMRWAMVDEAFVRPVQWIVALYGGEIVPLSMYGLDSGAETRGHRFLAPQPIRLAGTRDDYAQKLRQAFVLVDPAVRRTEIEAELVRIENEEKVRIRPDASLLDEVVNLVEYPKAVCGKFDERDLEIPAEIIVSAMRSHQRYFATERQAGKLANAFVTLAGTLTRDVATVARGNERVLRARLSDARFFFEEDRKTRLEDKGARLASIVFHQKLGTIGEKVTRLGAFADLFPVDPVAYARAATLCKADLVSKVVGEFPDLQGVMGQKYARLDGESAAVADAILEHYLPRGAGGELPASDLGAALGIADRLDTLVGVYLAVGAPSGSADPFGLRRAALGILHLLLARSWPISLRTLVGRAAETVAGKVKGDIAPVLEFLATRFRGLLTERGIAGDAVDAVLSAGADDVPDAARRAEAVSRLRKRTDFEPLAVAFKRVANILKGNALEGRPDEARFVHDSERALWSAFTRVETTVADRIAAHDYDAALSELAGLRGAIDKFFDDVMVMDKDETLQHNRRRVLTVIASTFRRIADFQRLEAAS